VVDAASGKVVAAVKRWPSFAELAARFDDLVAWEPATICETPTAMRCAFRRMYARWWTS
jgi:hypothetical protein